MSSKNPFVTNIDKMVKEGIDEMEKEPNVVKESITHTILK